MQLRTCICTVLTLLLSMHVGSKQETAQLESAFVDGEYTPFQSPLAEVAQNIPAAPPAKKKGMHSKCVYMYMYLLSISHCLENKGAAGKENQKPQKKSVSRKATKKTTPANKQTKAAKGLCMK